jgi:hypothetical protein
MELTVRTLTGLVLGLFCLISEGSSSLAATLARAQFKQEGLLLLLRGDAEGRSLLAR